MEISAKKGCLRVVNSLITPAQSAKIEIAKAYIRPLVGRSHKLHYPPHKIDAQKLDVDLEHINNERGRDISEAEARSYVANAVLSIRVWGNYERYFAHDGAAYVDVESGKIRTAFRKEAYNEKNKQMMEVCRRYGL